MAVYICLYWRAEQTPIVILRPDTFGHWLGRAFLSIARKLWPLRIEVSELTFSAPEPAKGILLTPEPDG